MKVTKSLLRLTVLDLYVKNGSTADWTNRKSCTPVLCYEKCAKINLFPYVLG